MVSILNFGDSLNTLMFERSSKTFSIESNHFEISIIKNKIDEKLYFDLVDSKLGKVIVGQKIVPNMNLLRDIEYRYNYGLIVVPTDNISWMQEVTDMGLIVGDYEIAFGSSEDINRIEDALYGR